MHRNLLITGITAALLLALGAFVIYTNTHKVQKISWPDENKVKVLITEEPIVSTSTEETTLEKPIEDIPKVEVEIKEEEPIKDAYQAPIEEVVPEPVLETPAVIEEPAPVTEDLSFGDINLAVRETLVNILCLTDGFNANITPISGSGTIIDERGIILTNAHIAQYFLLENYPTEGFVNCLIRTGSPAKATYKATLLHLSSPWVSENASAITTENPLGTGEHDFALLLIDEALGNEVLPETFAFTKPNTEETAILRNDEILVGAYPAGFLGTKTIQQSLYASTAITKAMEFYTFKSGSLDVISLGGTVVAQQGSSGGAVVSRKGEMVGLISTSSGGETTDDRDLRAISLSHIERSLVEHNGTTLEELLSGNIEQKATDFNETVASSLLQILVSTFLN